MARLPAAYVPVPPYVVTLAELELIVDWLGDAIEDAMSSLRC